MCPYKLEPLAVRLKVLTQSEFLSLLHFYTRERPRPVTDGQIKEFNIINAEALRRGITYNSNGLTIGVVKVEEEEEQSTKET